MKFYDVNRFWIKLKIRKNIFIHINKTAGTSISTSIYQDSKLHLTAREYFALVGKNNWNVSYKFSFVRNPYDRAVSLFEYRRKSGRTNLSFEKWVHHTFGVLNSTPELDSPKMLMPQTEWIKVDNAPALDFIGRFENLNEDWKEVSKILNISNQLPHLNKSQRDSHYKSYYNADSRKIIEKYFKVDLEKFSYTF